MRAPSSLLPAVLALVLPGAAQAGVVINEFFPNPTGDDDTVGLEWVELHNNTGDAIDVSGWTIESGTSSFAAHYTIPASTSIAAGGYLVIGESNVSAAGLKLATGAKLSLGNASNSDGVRIRNGSTTIDTVIYASPNTDLWIDDTGIAALSLAPKPAEGQALARTTNGVDTNASASDFRIAATITLGAANPGAAACSTSGTLVVNELMYDPAGSDDGNEWIELYNPGDATVDASGWTIESVKTTTPIVFTLPVGTQLPSHDYLLIGETNVANADVSAGSKLDFGNGDNGDAARVRDCAAVLRDTVIYGANNGDNQIDDLGAIATSIAPDGAEGTSAARKTDGVDTNLSGADFATDTTPTPNAMNDVGGSVETCENIDYDIKINEFMPDPAGTDSGQEYIELYNPDSGQHNLSGWKVQYGTSSFDKTVTLPADTVIEGHGFLLIGPDSIDADIVNTSIAFGNASSSGDGVRLADCANTVIDTVVYGANNTDGLIDDTGSAATSLAPKPRSGEAISRVDDGADTDRSAVDFELAAFPTPGDSNNSAATDCGASASRIKINEFVPNPPGADDGNEWVELYNAGDSTTDLTGWQIQTRTSSTWANEITFGAQTLAPGAFLLVGGAGVPNVDVSGSLGLPNGSNGDGVRVVDCRAFAADTVVYGGSNSDAIPDDSGNVATSWAPEAAEGASLQRLSDGYDTGSSGDDFVISASPTPGETNPEIEPVVCEPSDGTVFVNEFLPNPDSSDTDKEWFELYNIGGDDVSLGGWYVSLASTADEMGQQDVVFGSDARISGTGYLVVGGSLIEAADIVADFTLDNGNNGAAIALYDCEGNRVDSVIYGDNNTDGFSDDAGNVPDASYGDPPENLALARVEDGVDENFAGDWFIDGTPTPGETNHQDSIVDTGEDPAGGCKCGRRGLPDGTSSLEGSFPVWSVGLLAFIGVMRRRRA